MSYLATSVAKISGLTQVKLISINATVRPLKSMSLANIHASDSVSVMVFLANPTDNYYIFKNLSIPAKTSITLDSDDLQYDFDRFNLYIKLGASDSTVDVIIKS